MIFFSADFLKLQHNCFTIFQKFEIIRNILINAEAIHVSHTHTHTHTHTSYLNFIFGISIGF
jgi:hypothetical protein